MVDILNRINSFYNRILEAIPPQFRTLIAIVIIGILVISLVKFFKKNFAWVIIFILLLPATYPALKQIWLTISNLIQKAPK